MRQSTLAVVLVVLLATLMIGAVQAQGCYFGDGRINAASNRDCAAPVQLFQTDNEILVLTYNAELANKPEQFIIRLPRTGNIPAGSNELLTQTTNPANGRPVIISRLTTGEYQLNTFFDNGAAYIVVWYAGNDLYHIDPVTGQPLDGAQPIIVPGGATNVAVSSPPPAPAIVDVTTTAATDNTAAPASTGPVSASCHIAVTRIVRLRAAPNTSSAIITRLPYQTSWQVTERSAGWVRIIYQDTQGWVSSDFVALSGNC